MKRIVTQLSLLATTAILATGCVPVRHNLPPDQRLLEPGPGVGGPGPGVLGPPAMSPGMMGGGMMGAMGGGMPPGAIGAAPLEAMRSAPLGPMAAAPTGEISLVNYVTCGPDCQNCGGAGCSGGGMPMMPVPPTVQVTLGQPDGMQVRYDATGAGTFDSEPLVVPARQNFPQGGLYRLKLTNIPAREGVELYPTLELAYANPRTGAYLAHNSVPIQFTEEDFDQVLTGNFVTKVIYLPDPDFSGPVLAGIDTLVSTRLDPGIDPIVEADRRGSILAIIRLGDKDVEMAGTDGDVAGGMYGPPVAGLPAPFAAAMTEGCGPGESCGAASCGTGGCGCGLLGGKLGSLFNRGGSGGYPSGAGLPPSMPGMISGVSAPQYGMPMSGTPIGLPGPPHIPLGHPAGLQKHVIRNHTHMHIPQPVEKVKMNVRLQPGYSYPNPVSRVRITEQNIHPGVPNGRGIYQHASERVDPHAQP